VEDFLLTPGRPDTGSLRPRRGAPWGPCWRGCSGGWIDGQRHPGMPGPRETGSGLGGHLADPRSPPAATQTAGASTRQRERVAARKGRGRGSPNPAQARTDQKRNGPSSGGAQWRVIGAAGPDWRTPASGWLIGPPSVPQDAWPASRAPRRSAAEPRSRWSWHPAAPAPERSEYTPASP
jgi:hypothetical protein